MTDEIRGMIARSDPDAEFAKTVDVDASSVEPTVSLPHSPANAKPVSQVADRIDTVLLLV